MVRLLDPGRTTRRRWTGTRALAVRHPTCPVCERPTIRLPSTTQHPLLIGAGYGHAQRVTVEACGCGWRRLASSESVRPEVPS